MNIKKLTQLFSKTWPFLLIIAWIITLGLLYKYTPILDWFAWLVFGLFIIYIPIVIYVIFIKQRHQVLNEIRNTGRVFIENIKSFCHRK